MPVHDWSRVDAGTFHHFQHSWIEEVQRMLNSDLLPPEYYAMAEQQAGLFGPDVLTRQEYPKPDKSLTLAAYESGPDGTSTRAYVQPIAIGDYLPNMPLFLKSNAQVLLQLEASYERAFAADQRTTAIHSLNRLFK